MSRYRVWCDFLSQFVTGLRIKRHNYHTLSQGLSRPKAMVKWKGGRGDGGWGGVTIYSNKEGLRA